MPLFQLGSVPATVCPLMGNTVSWVGGGGKRRGVSISKALCLEQRTQGVSDRMQRPVRVDWTLAYLTSCLLWGKEGDCTLRLFRVGKNCVRNQLFQPGP